MASSSINNVFQFKISLKHMKPPIWRRIQVPADYTFRQLHFAIQDSMGWKSNFYNYHLHVFRMMVNRKRIEIGISEPDSHFYDFMETVPEERANLKDYFIEPKVKALYEYDLGASWEHDVVLEKILPALEGTSYPKCIAGKRVCPPEDGLSSSEDGGSSPEDGGSSQEDGGSYPGYEEHFEIMLGKKDVGRDPKQFDRNSVIFHEGVGLKEI